MRLAHFGRLGEAEQLAQHRLVDDAIALRGNRRESICYRDPTLLRLPAFSGSLSDVLPAVGLVASEAKARADAQDMVEVELRVVIEACVVQRDQEVELLDPPVRAAQFDGIVVERDTAR